MRLWPGRASRGVGGLRPGQPRPSPTGGTLVAALALIAELPLTPAEKAEAVRHLLAEHHAKEKA